MILISFPRIARFWGKLCCVCLVFCLAPVLSAETASSVSDTEAREKFIIVAKSYLGIPYRYGGTSKSGMDCSGFIYMAAQESLKLQLPRTAASLYSYAVPVPEAQRQPGDLVFFNTVGSKISHVGIFLGDNLFIHSASDGPRTGVIISSLDEQYWKKHYVSSGQVLEPVKIAAVSPGKSGGTSSSGDTSSSRSGTSSSRGSEPGEGALNGGKYHTDLELSGALVWNLLPGKGFFFNTRGGSVRVGAVYTGWAVHPGLEAELRFDSALGVTQLPLLASLSFNNFKVYAGPIFTFGTAVVPGSEAPANIPIFPGVVGVSWQTPRVRAGQFGFSLFQDVSYTFAEPPAGKSLTFLDSLTAGLLFTTGVRFSFSI